MSNAVMGKSPSYSDSIRFYERMSHLQEELKTYESQHFNLGEEFQRLWTQGTSVPFSVGGVEPKTTTPLVQLGHLSEKSQLLANPTNTNPQNYGDQDRLRARNERNAAILGKLQELETNASIFAARSERLRMMRNEYENLVRKYATHRPSSSEASHNFGRSRLFGQNKDGHSTITFTSTSMNTDITGPVIPSSMPSLVNQEKTSSLNIDIPPTDVTLPPYISEEYKHQNGGGLISISGQYPNASTSTFLVKNVPSFLNFSGSEEIPIRKPTFLDSSTSTTSESMDLKLKNKDSNQVKDPDNFDETSADTTSLSVLMPKSRGSNYILNVSTDGSLSDSTSTKQRLEPSIPRMSIFLPDKGDSKDIITDVDGTKAGANQNEIPNSVEKAFPIGSGLAQIERNNPVYANEGNYPDHEGDESMANNDSSLHSVGDSLMDSIHKTPESLSRDDSELAQHTTKKHEHNAGKEQSTPENENGWAKTPEIALPQIQENWNVHEFSFPEHRVELSPMKVPSGVQADELPQRESASVTDIAKHLDSRNLDDSDLDLDTDNNYSQQAQELRTEIPYLPSDGKPGPQMIYSGSSVPPLSGSTILKEETLQNLMPTESVSTDSGVNHLYELPEEKGNSDGSSKSQDAIAKLEFKETRLRSISEKKKQDSSSKIKSTDKRQPKPNLVSNIKPRRLKLNFDDSESEEHSEKGDTMVLNKAGETSGISSALQQNQIPTKEDLDAEFEDFFN